MSGFVVCPCCHATAVDAPPHGDGVPCPTALELHGAEVQERLAHMQLLHAQRDATVNSALKRG